MSSPTEFLLRRFKPLFFGLSAAVFSAASVHAGNSADNQSESAPSTRYGPFGLFDHSSQYGLGVLPEPFLVDDSDLEVNELRLDLFDTRTGAQHTDLFKAELEKGFGPVTFELEFLYERDVSTGVVSEGVNSINPGVRVPFYQ